MFELKHVSKDALERSLAMAERYRLLNEPEGAESICRDVLGTDPENQEALVMLILALTDQFRVEPASIVKEARDVIPRLHDEYARVYYSGLIDERWAKAQLAAGVPGYIAYDWLHEAMKCYEKAEQLSPPGNEDAVLRWNACVRVIERDDRLEPRPQDVVHGAGFSDEPPPR